MAEVKRILFVDDDADKTGDSIQELLNLQTPDSVSYSVKSCTKYQQAVEALGDADIVLVGVDLTIEYMPEKFSDLLPHLDENNIGYRLIRYIKEEYPRIRTIALATFSGCEDAPSEEETRAAEKGAHAFMVKPFRAMELVETIRRVDSTG